MEKQIDEEIEKLIRDSFESGLEEISIIKIQSSPFATNVNVRINDIYVKAIANFIKGDENKIKEIIKKHASELGEEISSYIKSCNENSKDEQLKLFNDIMRCFGMDKTK